MSIMMEINEKLTAANIRYLLTMKALSDAGKPIRNVSLAALFQYKKSSIHAMLKHLAAAGMIEKDECSVIYLTKKGAETAARYQKYYSTMDTVMQKCFPDFMHRENVVLALLAEIPEQELQRFSHQK